MNESISKQQSSILQVRDLCVWLKHPSTKASNRLYLVDHMNFDLQLGKTTALVGESGSGKSLTAHALMGLIPHLGNLEVSGQVMFENCNLLQQSYSQMQSIRGKKIAMVFQNPMQALNPVLSIGEQLIEMALVHVTSNEDEAFELAVSKLKEVHLADPVERMKDYPHQLSGGMRQRILIAMALMANPKILIADEPTTALDVTVQRQVLDLLHELQDHHGMTILLVSHDISIVSHYADDVLVMYASQLVEKGPCNILLNHPQHPYTQGLLQSRPNWNAPHTKLRAIPGNVPYIGSYPNGCHFHPRCSKRMNRCETTKPDLYPTNNESCLSRCLLYEKLP